MRNGKKAFSWNVDGVSQDFLLCERTLKFAIVLWSLYAITVDHS